MKFALVHISTIKSRIMTGVDGCLHGYVEKVMKKEKVEISARQKDKKTEMKI